MAQTSEADLLAQDIRILLVQGQGSTFDAEHLGGGVLTCKVVDGKDDTVVRKFMIVVAQLDDAY